MMTKVRKVALFQRIGHQNWTTLWELRDYDYEHEGADPEDRIIEDYMRISNWVEIEFVEAPVDAQVQNATKALDKSKEKLVAQHVANVREIDIKKADLLALAAPTENLS